MWDTTDAIWVAWDPLDRRVCLGCNVGHLLRNVGHLQPMESDLGLKVGHLSKERKKPHGPWRCIARSPLVTHGWHWQMDLHIFKFAYVRRLWSVIVRFKRLNQTDRL